MNLISRSCLDGFMCKYILSKPNNNPFIWNLIPLDSFKNLVEKYDSINFRNIEIFDNLEDLKLHIDDNCIELLEDYNFTYNAGTTIYNGKEMYYMIIDNCILMYSIHFHYNEMKNKEYCKDCKNEIECFKRVYLHNLEKMNETPIFFYNITHSDKIITYNTKYPVIYYSTDDNLKRDDVKYFVNIKPNKSNKTHQDMLDEPRQLVKYMKLNNVI